MSAPDTEERRVDWKSDLLQRLHDPIQLRIGVLAIVLAVGYGGVYLPLSAQVADTSRKLEQDQHGNTGVFSTAFRNVSTPRSGSNTSWTASGSSRWS
jgi:hypothetical protein